MEAPRVDTTRLQRLARSYAETAVFYAAIDLELFTHVSRGADSIASLADAMAITPLNAERLVVAALALGLLERDEAGALRNAADCEKFMVKDSPRYAGAWMTFTRHEVPDWFALTDRLRDTTPPSELANARRDVESTSAARMPRGAAPAARTRPNHWKASQTSVWVTKVARKRKSATRSRRASGWHGCAVSRNRCQRRR